MMEGIILDFFFFFSFINLILNIQKNKIKSFLKNLIVILAPDHNINASAITLIRIFWTIPTS